MTKLTEFKVFIVIRGEGDGEPFIEFTSCSIDDCNEYVKNNGIWDEDKNDEYSFECWSAGEQVGDLEDNWWKVEEWTFDTKTRK